MNVIVFRGEDGREVRAAAWEPGPASDVFIYLNGLESNHAWFAATAEGLRAGGAAVLGLDRRGSGMNAGLKPGCRAWLADIASCAAEARRRHPGARLHLVSLCFGAKLAAAFALRRGARLSSLVFISPGLATRVDLKPGGKIAAFLATVFSPGKTFPSPVADDSWFTEREEGLRFIASDPLRRRRIPAGDFVRGRRLDARLRLARRRFGIPCLVLFAERDRVVDKGVSRARLLRLARTPPLFVEYPGTAHCLPFEPGAPLSRDIGRWIGETGRPAALGARGGGRADGRARDSTSEKPGRSGKVLVLEADYQRLSQALERALEEFPRDWQGKSVLLKPNVICGLPPERQVTTDPRLVRAAADALLRRGARVVVGDNPGRPGYGENEASFRAAGILDAVPELYENIGLERERVRLPWAPELGVLSVSRAVLESDVVVSLPKFKTHQLTQLTGGVKNSFGFLVGGDKARLHRLGRTPRAFARVLVDVFLIRPPDLVIVDAVAGLQGEGPTGGDPRPGIDRLIVADDAVNADTVMAEMMGIDRTSVPVLEEAYARGLGQADFSRLDVRGSFIRLEDFKKASTYRRPLRNAGMSAVANRLLFGFLFSRRARLVVDAGACRSCGACQDGCPASPKAMVLAAGRDGRRLPRFNKASCIACYCCMEMCPHRAIDKATFLGRRIFRKIF
jgi:uncharacterized protein (DUF362 family)/alpha-beta hydrolase superfamily lysophospholipase/Pyruvate/2-oxoacid:ferredoxin oxidoreductase delta subunit